MNNHQNLWFKKHVKWPLCRLKMRIKMRMAGYGPDEWMAYAIAEDRKNG